MKKIIALSMLFTLAFASCEKSDEDTKYNPSKDGIVGEWYSKGANVATLLSTYFQVDSIYAKFESNNTYLVESYTTTGTKTTYIGTFAQSKPATGTIWNITLNQSSPTAVTSEGIFEITKEGDKYNMMYEVAQTVPSIGATPPTVAAGFGSTNGGALGTWNIQKFVKK